MRDASGGSDFIGNGVAAIVVSRWEGELDAGTLARELQKPTAAHAIAEVAKRAL